MTKLPGHVPQVIAFVWSCSKSLPATPPAMLCLWFTSRRGNNYKFSGAFSVFRCHIIKLLYSPHPKCSNFFASPECQQSGLGWVAYPWCSFYPALSAVLLAFV